MTRKMRRIKQQLDELSCREVLLSEGRGTLSVNGDDGYPYGFPINFLYDEGKIYFHTAAQGYKIDAVQKDNRVSFSVIDRGVPEPTRRGLNVRSVIVTGRLRSVADMSVKEDKLRRLGLKYFPDDPDYIEDEVQATVERVNIWELTIESITGKLVNES